MATGINRKHSVEIYLVSLREMKPPRLGQHMVASSFATSGIAFESFRG